MKLNKFQWLSIGLALLAFAPLAMSLGQKDRLVVPQYRDEGDSAVVFSTACPSTSWAQVASTDSIRRAMAYQTDPDLAAATVCLSTFTKNADACNEATPGIKLSTGSALTDYSGINWNCRARSGTVQVFGYWTRDSGDYGSIPRPR